MKFLVVGLGSMGKRRIRNLRHLGEEQVSGFDISSERRHQIEEQFGIQPYDNIDAALQDEPDALIISTPPDLHMPYAKLAAERGKAFFTEASVVDDGMDEVIELTAASGVVAAPSCTMRFHPALVRVKEIVDSAELGRPLAFTYHAGQYLPDWHPWEDYRTYYVARRPTGACREIVAFELVWLTWLLGPVHAIACMRGKLGRLEIDIDDAYQVLLNFGDRTLGHLLVDALSRVPYRHFRLLTEEGVVEWRADERVVRSYSAARGTWRADPEPDAIIEPGYVTPENMYIEEMRAFIKAVAGEARFPHTLVEDRAVLGLLKQAEQEAAAWVNPPPGAGS